MNEYIPIKAKIVFDKRYIVGLYPKFDKIEELEYEINILIGFLTSNKDLSKKEKKILEDRIDSIKRDVLKETEIVIHEIECLVKFDVPMTILSKSIFETLSDERLDKKEKEVK
jgi:hypothetical protein